MSCNGSLDLLEVESYKRDGLDNKKGNDPRKLIENILKQNLRSRSGMNDISKTVVQTNLDESNMNKQENITAVTIIELPQLLSYHSYYC